MLSSRTRTGKERGGQPCHMSHVTFAVQEVSETGRREQNIVRCVAFHCKGQFLMLIFQHVAPVKAKSPYPVAV